MGKTARKPKYRLTLLVEAANINSVESKIKKHFGDAVLEQMKKVDLPNSRPARLTAVHAKVNDASKEIETLKQELSDWYDSLPDVFRNGQQGEDMQSAMDRLSEIKSELENVDFSGVEFPGMRT